MEKGDNRARFNEVRKMLFAENIDTKKPCIFLSHRSLDKEMVRTIADYIAEQGIDYYLDEEDPALQEADKNEDDQATVDCIKEGIGLSSHILCVLSYNTVSSWWVPFEVGYADCLKKKVASLKIKDLSDKEIPAFLRIYECLAGIKEFNKYLVGISDPYGGLFSKYNKQQNGTTSPSVEIAYTQNHPLYDTLDE